MSIERKLCQSTFQLLSNSLHFRQLSPLKRFVLSRQVQVIHLNAGDCLVEDMANRKDVYVLCSGKIKIVRTHSQCSAITYELTAGNMIGHLEHFVDNWQDQRAIATRDSLLLKIPCAVFKRFINRHPRLSKDIAKSSLEDLLLHNPKPHKSHNICLVPVGNSAKLATFIHDFTKQLANARVIHLNETIFHNIFGTAHNSLNRSMLIQWLDTLEKQYDFILFEANAQANEWSKQCVRQADDVLLVNYLASSFDQNQIENYLQKHTGKKHFVHVHLDRHTSPRATHHWLTNRPVQSCHHVIIGESASFQRVIRYLTHQSEALVLGGGGARGLCHIGIYRAMQECGMPIDCVGGTSAGAIMGALIAMGYDHQTISETVYEHIVCNRRLLSFTLPIHSLRSGKQLSFTLQHIYGEDRHIEDLWLRFFCIATSLTNMCTKMISTGVLWRNLRASISLPGIFPPLTTVDKELLIDGAVTNNLPVELMNTFANNGHITAAKVSGLPRFVSQAAPNGYISVWNSLLDQFKHRSMPTFPQVIMESVMLSGNRDFSGIANPPKCFIECDTQGFDPLNFKPFRQLVDLGYQTAMETFEKHDKALTKQTDNLVLV